MQWGIRSELLSQLGLEITVSAIGKFLYETGLKAQVRGMKLCIINLLWMYNKDMLVFLDETGTDSRDTFRGIVSKEDQHGHRSY